MQKTALPTRKKPSDCNSLRETARRASVKGYTHIALGPGQGWPRKGQRPTECRAERASFTAYAPLNLNGMRTTRMQWQAKTTRSSPLISLPILLQCASKTGGVWCDRFPVVWHRPSVGRWRVTVAGEPVAGHGIADVRGVAERRCPARPGPCAPLAARPPRPVVIPGARARAAIATQGLGNHRLSRILQCVSRRHGERGKHHRGHGQHPCGGHHLLYLTCHALRMTEGR